jgi:hypothetical protein
MVNISGFMVDKSRLIVNKTGFNVIINLDLEKQVFD